MTDQALRQADRKKARKKANKRLARAVCNFADSRALYWSVPPSSDGFPAVKRADREAWRELSKALRKYRKVFVRPVPADRAGNGPWD